MICETCFRKCDISKGQTGFCKGRMNEDGYIIDRNYGKITSLALDPIEKKPLARFLPGSLILSVGSYGCNMRCPFCQNHSIAQEDLEKESLYVSPETLAEKAGELVPQGNIGIAFTYNEPTISWEYIRDTGKLAKGMGLKTVVVTNGCASDMVLDALEEIVDAYNIDLKAFDENTYKWMGGDLETVKHFIVRASQKAHVELTTLIIPGKNDSPEEIEKMCRWIASINPDIPLHLTRYFPRWKENTPATSIESLKELKNIADKYLHHVYLGNV